MISASQDVASLSISVFKQLLVGDNIKTQLFLVDKDASPTISHQVLKGLQNLLICWVGSSLYNQGKKTKKEQACWLIKAYTESANNFATAIIEVGGVGSLLNSDLLTRKNRGKQKGKGKGKREAKEPPRITGESILRRYKAIREVHNSRFAPIFKR